MQESLMFTEQSWSINTAYKKRKIQDTLRHDGLDLSESAVPAYL